MQKKNRGLTLLELVLAMCMLGGVLFAVTTLHLSSAGTKLTGDQDIRMQGDLDYVFRDMEIYLRDGVCRGSLTQYPDGAPGSPGSGPLFYRGTLDTASVWLGVLTGEFVDAADDTRREIWYGYKFPAQGPSQVVRRVYDVTVDPVTFTETVLSQGILSPYAEVDPGSESVRDTCLASPSLAKTLCEDEGVYPVFKVSSDKRLVYASFMAKGTILDGKKEVSTPGMTKAIFMRSTVE